MPSKDVEAFGPVAERYGACLSGVPAIVADPSGPVFALAAAANRRRRTAEPFFTSILLDDPRAVVAVQVGAALLDQQPDFDQRRTWMTQLGFGGLQVGGTAAIDIQPYADPVLRTLKDFLLLGHALLARSAAERDRLDLMLGRGRSHCAIFPGCDASVPDVNYRPGGDAIVVWAPHQSARDASIIAFALEELHAPLFVVCAGGTLSGLRAQCVGVDRAADVLERALVVIDASIGDPAAAIALAQAGFPLVVSSTSGAAECLNGVYTYDPWSWDQVLGAVSKARAANSPVVRSLGATAETLRALLQHTVPDVAPDAPLVSILVPTFNRRQKLDEQLERLSAQTYPNIEVVVANDAGEPVDDIVEKYPKARLVNCARNGGAARATNAALAAAKGEYVSLIADDDTYYGDHIARMVQAAGRSQSAVLHANIIQRLLDKTPEGYRVRGYLFHYDKHLDMTSTLAVVEVSVQGMVMKRSLFATQPLYDDESPLTADSDLVIRLSRKHDFTHVDYAGGEWLCPHDETAQSSGNPQQLLDEIQRMYARYPAPGREWIEAKRAAALAEMQTMFVGKAGFEPAIRLPDAYEE